MFFRYFEWINPDKHWHSFERNVMEKGIFISSGSEPVRVRLHTALWVTFYNTFIGSVTLPSGSIKNYGHEEENK
jgi:hypothetical protein